MATISTQTAQTNTEPFKLPSQPQDTTDYNGLIQSQIDNVGSLNQKVSEYEQSVNADEQAIRNLRNTLGLETKERTDLENQNNIKQQQQEILNASNQLNTLAAQAKAIPIKYENLTGGERTTGGVLPLQESELRRNAIQALTIGADLAAKQGNLSLAQQNITNAINAKYKAVEADLLARKEAYEMNKENLSRYDKKRAESLAYNIKKQEEKYAEEKKNYTDIQNMIIEATPNAPANVVANARKLAESGASKLAVAQALGKYGGDYLGNLVKLSTIAKNNKEYEKTVEEIKKLNQPLQNIAPVGSNAHSTNSWVNSAVNKESLSAGEREKISKSFAVVGQLGNLATALQKDQTSFFGGKVREIKAALGADANAGAIQAQITALVPQVARGTFGEVGVLTDADISNYKKVIGNLSSPNAQNAAVTAMTLTALRNGVKSQLDTAAASKLDVSRFVPMYQDLTNQINSINDEIGVTDGQVRDYMLKNPQTQTMIEALILEGRKGSEILQILGVEN